MANKDPLLSLSTTLERKHIKIDGKAYPIRSLDEFSLIERHRIAVDAKAMKEVDKLGGDESEVIEKASEALRRSVLQIIVDGEEIIDKLNDENKFAIINCFFEQVTGKNPSAKKLKPLADSSDSTGAVRKIG